VAPLKNAPIFDGGPHLIAQRGVDHSGNHISKTLIADLKCKLLGQNHCKWQFDNVWV
jgi:hypothetical protein